MLHLVTLPIFAENWVQLETGFYVDTNSLTKFYLPSLDNVYSVQTKSDNDCSNNFRPNEYYFSSLVLINEVSE